MRQRGSIGDVCADAATGGGAVDAIGAAADAAGGQSAGGGRSQATATSPRRAARRAARALSDRVIREAYSRERV